MKENYWKQRIKPKLELIEGWARNGLSHKQIALNLNVSLSTLNRNIEEHEELADAIDIGENHSNVMVENALYKRALGYKYKEVTKERVRDPETGEVEFVTTKTVTKYQAPDVNACTYWLENRIPTRWSRSPVNGVDGEVVVAGLKSLADLLLNPVKERQVENND